jgi:hypothetical protein
MARSDKEIEHLWRAYQAAGDFLYEADKESVISLFEDDWEKIEIPFERELFLCLQAKDAPLNILDSEPEFEKIPDITSDEAAVLNFKRALNRLYEPKGKMQRNDVAAKLFNKQLGLDKKHGHRILEKPIKGGALLMALRRANKL